MISREGQKTMHYLEQVLLQAELLEDLARLEKSLVTLSRKWLQG
jgi:hypothetical protein